MFSLHLHRATSLTDALSAEPSHSRANTTIFVGVLSWLAKNFPISVPTSSATSGAKLSWTWVVDPQYARLKTGSQGSGDRLV